MIETIIVILIVIAIIYYLCYVRYQKSEKEGFGLVYGTMAPQMRWYDRCVESCFQDYTGDPLGTSSQYRWVCERKCMNMAIDRVKKDLPDITVKQHAKYGGKCWASEDPQQCECFLDLEKWCKQQIEPFSSNPLVMSDCIRTRAVGCTAGLYGGNLRI